MSYIFYESLEYRLKPLKNYLNFFKYNIVCFKNFGAFFAIYKNENFKNIQIIKTKILR